MFSAPDVTNEEKKRIFFSLFTSRRRHRCVPHRSREDEASKPTVRLVHWRTDVQELVGLPAESHQTRGIRRLVPRPRSPAGRRGAGEGHQADGAQDAMSTLLDRLICQLTPFFLFFIGGCVAQVNDFVRDRFMDPKSKKIALSAEMLAGACVS